MTLADIVVAITAGQYSNSNADITSEKEDMVRLSLRLNLPILADAGLVKHNSTTDEVSLTDFARELRPYIYPFIVAESPDALLDI